MEKTDGRFLNPATQNYLRQQAIRLRQQGKRFVDIAKYLGVHRNTVSEWWWQYQQDGEAALTSAKAGSFAWRRPHPQPGRRTPSPAVDASKLPRRVRDRQCLVDTSSSAGVDPAGVRGSDADSHSWGISQAVGIYAAKAIETRL